MKLTSLKPAAYIAGFLGLLYVGDKINAGSFVGDTFQSIRGYTSDFAPRKVLQDMQTTDPKEVSEAMTAQQVSLEEFVHNNAPDIKTGSYDAPFAQIEQTARSMLALVYSARSAEGNAAQLAKACSVDTTATYLTALREASPTTVDQQAMSYIIVAEQALSEDAKKDYFATRIGPAVLGNYLDDGNKAAAFDLFASRVPFENVFAAAVDSVPGANKELQESFGVDVLVALPSEQQYDVMASFLSKADSAVVDKTFVSGAPYCSDTGKSDAVHALIDSMNTGQRVGVIGEATKGMASGVYDSIGKFFKSSDGSM